ncbi:MAG TPA: ferritin-like domain-containing protein [Solirubrobacteraceae bacterium]|nr:ferritin-like domain-containing protein [Solirubrobacteraceae bacterium]
MSACGGEDQGPAAGPQSVDEGAVARDLDIVNYALTLEFVEADLYDAAVESDLLSGRALEYAREFGETEREHASVLTTVASQLGGAVDAPRTDFSAVLTDADTLLSTIADLENVGAAAYLGQAPRVQSRQILASALAIHTVEARHAAALNELIGRGFQANAPLRGSVPTGAFARPMSMAEVLPIVERYIAS